jgi:hypothetical protein
MTAPHQQHRFSALPGYATQCFDKIHAHENFVSAFRSFY